MEVSQSVLSVSFSDSPHSAEPHTVTWGENDTQEIIDSDEDTRTAHNNTTEEETKPESQEENREQDDKHEEDREYDTVLIDGVLYHVRQQRVLPMQQPAQRSNPISLYLALTVWI